MCQQRGVIEAALMHPALICGDRYECHLIRRTSRHLSNRREECGTKLTGEPLHPCVFHGTDRHTEAPLVWTERSGRGEAPCRQRNGAVWQPLRTTLRTEQRPLALADAAARRGEQLNDRRGDGAHEEFELQRKRAHAAILHAQVYGARTIRR